MKPSIFFECIHEYIHIKVLRIHFFIQILNIFMNMPLQAENKPPKKSAIPVQKPPKWIKDTMSEEKTPKIEEKPS